MSTLQYLKETSHRSRNWVIRAETELRTAKESLFNHEKQIAQELARTVNKVLIETSYMGEPLYFVAEFSTSEPAVFMDAEGKLFATYNGTRYDDLAGDALLAAYNEIGEEKFAELMGERW